MFVPDNMRITLKLNRVAFTRLVLEHTDEEHGHSRNERQIAADELWESVERILWRCDRGRLSRDPNNQREWQITFFLQL